MSRNRIHAQTAFYAGVIMTLAGNGLAAAEHGPISVAIGVSAPLALLLVWEMTTRTPSIPSRRRWYHRAGRIIPSLAIMGLTAYMSFGHLRALAEANGQSGLWALLPDALMMVASAVLRDAPTTRKSKTVAADEEPAVQDKATRKCAPDCQCLKHARNRTLTATEQTTPAVAIRALPKNAPTSPAPLGA